MLGLPTYFQVRIDDSLHCDLPLEGRRIRLEDPRYLELLNALADGCERDDAIARTMKMLGLDHEAAATVVDDLVREHVLRDGGAHDGRADAIAHWERRGWMDALKLHLVSRDVAFDDDQAADLGALHDDLFAALVEREAPPPFWKTYPERPRVPLPEGEAIAADRPFEEVLLARRSNRPWLDERLSLARLATILRAGNDATRRLRLAAEAEWRERPRVLLQSAFCAVETYVFAFAVDGLEPGIYHYDPRDAALLCVRPGLARDELAQMCAGQPRPGEACCAVAMTGVFERYMYRYRHARAYRTLLVNVAELAQKYIMLATTFGLSTFITPLFFDEIASELLGVDGYEEAVLEVVAFG